MSDMSSRTWDRNDPWSCEATADSGVGYTQVAERINAMSDTPENFPPQSEGNKHETVGETIRKERVTRRIAIETVARDLKLNASYIKALESGNYDDLPADPYVRVYLKSIAGYLMLDPEDILRRFYNERGLPPADYESERATRINISVKGIKEPAKFSRSMIFLAVVVVAVAALLLTALFGTESDTEQETGSEQTTTQEETTGEEGIEGIPIPIDSIPDDTEGIETETDTGAEAEITDQTANDDVETAETSPDSLQLEISIARDSVWLQVFEDGDSWKNFVHANETRTFSARDSLNIHVGNNRLMKYTLNGEPLKVKGRGVLVFKIDHEGVDMWTLSKWLSVFKGRI